MSLDIFVVALIQVAVWVLQLSMTVSIGSPELANVDSPISILTSSMIIASAIGPFTFEVAPVLIILLGFVDKLAMSMSHAILELALIQVAV